MGVNKEGTEQVRIGEEGREEGDDVLRDGREDKM